MKKAALIFISTLLSIAACAANDKANLSGRTQLDNGLYKCTYTYTAKTTVAGKDDVVTSETVLHIGEHGAKFADESVFIPDSLVSVGAPGNKIQMANLKTYGQDYPFTATVYQNYPEGKTTMVDVCQSNYAVLTENIDVFDWELTEDTLTVCNHLCYKAIAKYGGRTWEAWYADDIPLSYGPWKLAGLPGLILAAHDTDGVNSFVINSMQHSDVIVTRVKNVKEVPVNRKDYIRLKDEYENQKYSISGTTELDLNEYKSQARVFIGGIPLIFRSGKYVHLELE